jgi:two-component system, cell cycle response regulator CpdR
MRLLLAEDDADFRELLSAALEIGGATVVAVANGREALERIDVEGDAFDVMVFDVRMPGMTGLDVLCAARARGNHVPVVLITSFCDPELEERGQRLGAARVIDKLVDLELLRQVVRDAARPAR